MAATPRSRLDSKIREMILNRDGGKCQKCGSNERLEIHHKIPVCQRGSDEVENLITMCFQCHRHMHRGLYSKNTRIVNVDYSTARWIEEQIKSKKFENVDRLFEFAVSELMRKED